ncbi:MAG: SpoIIE family protein phosphatase [Bacteroidales bacterium]|nr:SpoIIE family protein phosphatase [Bacteroidales bacterium]
MQKKIFILSLIIFANYLFVFSQNEKIDSLLVLYEKNKNTELISEISRAYSQIRDFEQTIVFAEKGLDISRNKKNVKKEAEFLEIIAESYFHTSNYDKSLKHYEAINKLTDNYEILDKKGVVFLGLSKNYWRKGKYEKAIYFGTEAVKFYEKKGDITNSLKAKGNLGTVYLDVQDYDRAEKLFDEILIVFKNKNDSFGIANTYEKKGVIKFFKSFYPYSRKYYFKAYNIYKSLGKELEAAIELGNIAETYEMEKDYKKAVEFYKKAIKTEKEFNYYSGLIFLYQALGRSHFKLKKYNKAKESYLTSLNYINKIGEQRELINTYKLLYQLYEETGDYRSAFKYSLSAMQVKDSIVGIKVRNQINEIRIKYESEKKETENKLLKENQVLQQQIIKVQKKENRKQFLVIIIISLLLIFIVIFSILLFKFNKKNKKTSLILKNKNTLLNEAYSDINISIEYAGKIQKAMLSSFENINHDFSEYAIYNKPAGALSGDFYWSKKIKNTIFIAVADSTGHGVPGALLSITGMSFLNEIVTEYFIQPDTILNNLRDKIKKSLNQKGNFKEQKDGWDMSVFAYNEKTKEVQFAGAYNSLYLISGKGKNKTMIKYSADRQPVGIHYRELPFTVHNFKVEKGNIMWLFTDGYSDQFNNEGTKKYSSKRLKNLLLSISDKTMNEQNKIIKDEFENWKGSFNQVDDVLITGIKI